MIPAAILACANLAVPAPMMHHVAMVESSGNPYAIGVVGGRLLRQPDNLAEAIATAEELAAQGYNFSVGVAQVNRANLAKYGLDSYRKAFDICDNLRAGSRILADCRARMHGRWDKALSCYYAGDPETGLREGYVQKVFASLGAAASSAAAPGRGAVMPAAVIPAVAGKESRADPADSVGSHAAAFRRVSRRALPIAPAGVPAEPVSGAGFGEVPSAGNHPGARAQLRPLPGSGAAGSERIGSQAPDLPAAAADPDAATALAGGAAPVTRMGSGAPPAVAIGVDPAGTGRAIAPAVASAGEGAAQRSRTFVPRVLTVADRTVDATAGTPGNADGPATRRPTPDRSEPDAAFVF